ncbi:TrkA family potassium uptake protein [Mangrovimicrobium sediminis]|uniref:TrkA family potassium uptake protein n=1 Tax=Mangrovimicrobium sediminis TaxID=2562682 RepID=A0A4Z0M1Q2_9GAMM|nr:TrkA family potassium uptake protein [Haliea sp. SAOS-164]TGD73410.1 TrkA family potassium uptake protein [Haliea sp. SAOS-164]
MRIVFVGAGTTAVATARQLISQGHSVIVIERDAARVQELSGELDCGLIHGDGTRPDILREADTSATDVLLCMADMDQENILTSLVGQVENIPHIITKVQDPQFEKVAIALGLENIVVPSRAMARHLVDLIESQDTLEASPVVKGDARVFSFIVTPAQAGPLSALKLPSAARAVCLYREGHMEFVDAEDKLREGDEVVVLTHEAGAAELHRRLSKAPEA